MVNRMSRLVEHRMDNKNTKATLIKYVTNSKMAWFTNIHWLRKPIFQSKYLGALIHYIIIIPCLYESSVSK